MDSILQAMDEEHARYRANIRALIENAMSSPHFQMDSTPTLRPTDSGFNTMAPLYRSSHRPSMSTHRPSLTGLGISSHQGASSIRSLALDDECGDQLDVLPLLDDTTNLPVRHIKPEVDAHLHQQFVRELLPSVRHTESELVAHLRECHTFGAGTQVALGDIVAQSNELEESSFFEGIEGVGDASDPFHDASYEIYDICRTGKAIPRHDEDDDDRRLEAREVWSHLNSLNASSSPSTVGRITILAEPSPRVFGAVHYTLGTQFDMDELLGHLVSGIDNNGRTRACMQRAFKEKPIHQRTFFFVFKYYTVTGDSTSTSTSTREKEGAGSSPAKSPYPFQQFDRRPAEKKKADHIDIAEASSVIALSLSGSHTKEVYLKHKRRRPIKGTAYSAFSPWQVLLLQTFPDDEHTTRDHHAPQSYPCGPLAFLDLLASEYRDAGKRLERLMRRITKLITPPLAFMFDPKLRDGLLFEDAHYTYSRRYFWAYNTLGVINDGISGMIHAYEHAFPPAFWSASSPDGFFIPDSADDKTRADYIQSLGQAKRELDAAVRSLHNIWMANESVRHEIKSLRDQLFSGSSVKESRRAIEQGDNIKVLTILSMVFLPLSFVASVFGITELHIKPDDWRFPVTMVLVCVPFLLFVLLSQTRTGMRLMKGAMAGVRAYFSVLDTGATGATSVPAPTPAANASATPAAVDKHRERQQQRTAGVRFVGQRATMEESSDSPSVTRPRFDRRISRRSVTIPRRSIEEQNQIKTNPPLSATSWWGNMIASFIGTNPSPWAASGPGRSSGAMEEVIEDLEMQRYK